MDATTEKMDETTVRYSYRTDMRRNSEAVRIADSMTVHYHNGGRYGVKESFVTSDRCSPWAMVAAVEAGSIHLDQADGDSVTVRAGNLLVTPPGLRHRLTCEATPEFRCSWAHLSCEVMDGLDVFDILQVAMIISGDRFDRFRKINDRILSLLPAGVDAPAFADLAEWNTLRFELAHILLQDAALAKDGERVLAFGEGMQKALASIGASDGELPSTGRLASAAGLSESRFRAVFSSVFRCSPMQYCARQRIKRACRMLLTSKMRVSEIAQAVGYSDPYYFSRVFSREMGRGPRRYREEVRTGF